MLKAKWRAAAATALVGTMMPAAAYAAPGWTAPSTISQIITAENYLTVILTTGSNPMSCASTTWYRLPTTAANYQTIAANLMTAKAQGKSVEVWASACDADGVSLIVAAWMTN